MSGVVKYGLLILSYFVYSLTGLFTKSASLYPFMSWQYILFVIGAIVVLGIYAVLWQQVLKHIPLTDAYMFKGTSLIFVLVLSAVIFSESITMSNIIGAAVIVTGITLYAKVSTP